MKCVLDLSNAPEDRLAASFVQHESTITKIAVVRKDICRALFALGYADRRHGAVELNADPLRRRIVVSQKQLELDRPSPAFIQHILLLQFQTFDRSGGVTT